MNKIYSFYILLFFPYKFECNPKVATKNKKHAKNVNKSTT